MEIRINRDGTEFGPYLQQAPVNGFTNATNLAADNTQDWEYIEATGAIRAIVPAAMTQTRCRIELSTPWLAHQ